MMREVILMPRKLRPLYHITVNVSWIETSENVCIYLLRSPLLSRDSSDFREEITVLTMSVADSEPQSRAAFAGSDGLHGSCMACPDAETSGLKPAVPFCSSGSKCSLQPERLKNLRGRKLNHATSNGRKIIALNEDVLQQFGTIACTCSPTKLDARKAQC